MYLGQWLQTADKAPADEKAQTYEYRLIVSGEFFNGKFSRNNVFTRRLVESPFSLTVAESLFTGPIRSYPSELALSITVPPVTENIGRMTRIWYPVEEIVHDLAAVLTLFTRRLVTVAGATRFGSPAETGLPFDLPVPIATAIRIDCWPSQPTISCTTKDGTTVRDYLPLPKVFDPDAFAKVLSVIRERECGPVLVQAARLYAQAMAIAHTDPPIAYLLLTLAAETVANHAVNSDDGEPPAAPPAFAALARGHGLSPEVTSAMYTAAIHAGPRSTFKFQRFLLDHATEDCWGEDDLFRAMNDHRGFLPSRERLSRIVRDVYSARSGLVHRGVPYPLCVGLGISPISDTHALDDFFAHGELSLPPLPWLERLVNTCINEYVRRQFAEPPRPAAAAPD